ncbi:MAG TPA: hypothetical protein VIW26_13010 [Gemmatimonadales bacterium]
MPELDGHIAVGIDHLGDTRCRRCGGLIMETPPAEEEEEEVDLLDVQALALGWSPERIGWLKQPRTARALFPEVFGPAPRRRRERPM